VAPGRRETAAYRHKFKDVDSFVVLTCIRSCICSCGVIEGNNAGWLV